jgi:hypothetical protein
LFIEIATEKELLRVGRAGFLHVLGLALLPWPHRNDQCAAAQVRNHHRKKEKST